MDPTRRMRHLMGMATTVIDELRSGDVIELGADDEGVTALVLLVSGDRVILDRCDDSTPVVVDLAELGEWRVFRPEVASADAAA